MKKLILKLYMVFLIGNFGTAQLMAQLQKLIL